MEGHGYLRIGELSRRTGVSPELLRAWERRYGLLQPERTPGGFRLYTDSDEARVRSMQAKLARGLSAAQAAQLALAEQAVAASGPDRSGSAFTEVSDHLRKALDSYDEAGAQAALDRLFAGFSLDSILRDVVIPVVRELGERHERGAVPIAQERFASNLIRGRLTALARGWGQGVGPGVVLACPPEELHDLALVGFGLALRARGWRITYLGIDTPIATVAEAARAVLPAAVVISAETGEHLVAAAEEIAVLAREFPVALAGAGATPELALRTGAQLLRDDPVTAAERLALSPEPPARPEAARPRPA
jgi:MerR family transcriptional regulator, light-induced transcriptional regulator